MKTESATLREFEKRIKSISNTFSPLKEIAIRFSNFGIVQDNYEFLIYNQPEIAPQKYAIYIFNETPQKFFDRFQAENQIEIPSEYEKFLKELNGCFIFDFDLFGLTPSIYEKGTLDRTKVQCFDIGSANLHWKREYKNIDFNLFHFGGRAFSDEENIGYFMDLLGNIKSVRKNGEILNEWNNFSTFLKDEIHNAELYENNKNK